jgi:hypothetical protein
MPKQQLHLLDLIQPFQPFYPVTLRLGHHSRGGADLIDGEGGRGEGVGVVGKPIGESRERWVEMSGGDRDGSVLFGFRREERRYVWVSERN